MAANTPDKQQVHELIEQLGADRVAAVLHLLEVMVEPADESLSEDDRRAVAASREYFQRNPEGGVPFEKFAAECGFTMDPVLGHKD
jgi:hypothetical protein